MAKFLVRRLIVILLSFLTITAVLYAAVMISPPTQRAQLYLNRRSSMYVTPRQIENSLNKVIEQHGLRDPYPVQYVRWLGRLAQGEWGWSPTFRQDVLSLLVAKSPATLELTFYSLLLFLPLGLISGVTAGWRPDGPFDVGFRLLAYAATAVPAFILGLMLLSFFYVGTGWFPPGRQDFALSLASNAPTFRTFTHFLTLDGLLNGRPDIALDALRHLILPAFTLSLAHWATLGRVARAMMVEEMGKDYVVAAKAKGLANRTILWRHTFRNAAPPAITTTALSAASLVTGVFIVEAVFAFPGVSKLIVNTMTTVPDLPMALGFSVYSVLVVMAVMLILDVVQFFLSPRLRAQ